MKLSPAPEYALLLDAIAPEASGPPQLPSWSAEQWERTLRIARWHRLMPVLHRHLARTEGAPSEVRAEVEQAYLANAARNLFVRAELDGVLGALADVEVPAMLLKGAALVRTAYPDPALREMLDLDLLVPAAQLDAANSALAAVGYQAAPAPEHEQRSKAWMRASHHHDPALVTDRRIAAVELHHHIAMTGERAHFGVAGIWERARQGEGAPAHLLPAADDLLLHVCLHFTRNRLGGSYRWSGTGGALAQLCDIAWITHAEAVDWDRLVAVARSARLDARVFLALFAARELGISIPVGSLQALRPAGFDPRLGRRLVALRVLRSGRQLPVRSLRFMVAPRRDVLTNGWNADANGSVSLVLAYARRARAQAPLVRGALRRPWTVVQDYRLNGQIDALEHRE